mgnify:CR=1 FL=1
MGKLTLAAWLVDLTSGAFYEYGYNKYNIGKNFKTIHAEVDAVKKLKYSKTKKKIDILIFRTNKYGDCLKMAKPCQNCITSIMKTTKLKNYRLSKIHYTNEDGKIEFIKTCQI